MAKTLGIINLHSDVRIKGLADKRPVASVSFLGRYGIIDFALSNLSNSQIDKVAVLIQDKPRSLLKHMGYGNAWNFNSKSGGVSLLMDEQYMGNPSYNHDVNNLIENIAFIEKNEADYVVITPAHVVTTMNYADIVAEHEASGSPISIVYKAIDNADVDYVGCNYIKLNGNKVAEIKENKGNKKERNISLATYVINKDELLKLLKQASEISAFFNLKETLAYVADEKDINAIEYRGFAMDIRSLASYFQHSLSMCDIEVFTQVFKSNWPIYTNTNDTPPTKYKEDANVKSSIVANGAIIDGQVEHSIISRNVVIGKGAVVKNSILLNGASVAANAVLENVILDKDAQVKMHTEIAGTPEAPLYVKEGDII